MKYTVSINEKSRSITVTLADGTKGVARCNPSDRFDINTGIELALERAKVASKAKEVPPVKPMGIMELVRALEKAIPKGQLVVIGNGKELTAKQKKWLIDLAGGCQCEVDEDEIYNRGYEEGYNDGYADAEAELEPVDAATVEDLEDNIRGVLNDFFGV